MKKGDYLVAAAIAASAVVIALAMVLAPLLTSAGEAAGKLTGDLYAVVTYPGGSESLPLSRDTRFAPEGAKLSPVVVVSGGEVYVESSGCRDKICVMTGKISKPGQLIVCVPARLTVKVEGRSGNAYADFFAG